MSQWARLHVETSDSEDVAALQAKDPNAALLFLMGMPHAMPWGVLPGSPALFRAKVCPLFDVSLSTVETCLRLLIDSGMMIGYTDSRGKPLVYYAAWNRYQGAQQWSRVGPPPHDLPPSWEPPANLRQALLDAAREKRPLTAKAIEARLLSEESKTRLRLVLEESCLRSKQSESEADKANDLLPKPAAPAAADEPLTDGQPTGNEAVTPAVPAASEPEKPKAKPVAALSEEDFATRQAELRARIPADCQSLVDAYIDAAANANKTKRVQAGRVLTLLSELADAAEEYAHTHLAFKHGLQAAVNKAAVNVNYLRKAAHGFCEERNGNGGGGNGKAKPFSKQDPVDLFRQWDQEAQPDIRNL